MKRELANKMYTPSAYFLGRFFSHIILQVLSPIIMISILFWKIGIVTDQDNWLLFMAYGCLGNIIYVGQGYFIGIVFNEEATAKLVNLLVIMVMFCTNGVLCNTGTANAFIVFISKYSPSRMMCEGFYRRVTFQIPDLSDKTLYSIDPTPFDDIAKFGIDVSKIANASIPISQKIALDQLNYDYGDPKCIMGMAIWLGFWFIASIIGINMKFRKL